MWKNSHETRVLEYNIEVVQLHNDYSRRVIVNARGQSAIIQYIATVNKALSIVWYVLTVLLYLNGLYRGVDVGHWRRRCCYASRSRCHELTEACTVCCCCSAGEDSYGRRVLADCCLHKHCVLGGVDRFLFVVTIRFAYTEVSMFPLRER